MRKGTSMSSRGGIGISRPSSTAPPRCLRRTHCWGEVPLYLRHGPEKGLHRFSGCLIVSLTITIMIRPFVKSLFEATGESYTLGASQARSAKAFCESIWSDPRVAGPDLFDWTFLTVETL